MRKIYVRDRRRFIFLAGSTMASVERRRKNNRNSARFKPRVRPATSRSSHAAGAGGAAWPGRTGPFIVAALVLIGLGAWWATSYFSSSADTAGSAEPISTLDTPDFHSLLVGPQDPEHILFGSHAGIQESFDGGFTWEDGELRDVDAMQLTASPKAPETIYATGHDVFQVSHDGGQSWQAQAHDLPGTDIHGFAQDPDDPQRLYAFVVGAGTFTSRDGGTSWKPLRSQSSGDGTHLVLASDGSAVYALTEAGLAKSTDQGATWSPLPSQPSGQMISLAIPASAPQTLYAGTPNGLEKSIDGGETWTALGPEAVPVLALAASATNPEQVLFVSDTGGVYRSDDGGRTWRS